MNDFPDDPTLPSRMKSGARKAVREILVFYALATLAGAIVGMAIQEPGPGGESFLSFLAISAIFLGWVGLPAWGVYRIVRFAIGH